MTNDSINFKPSNAFNTGAVVAYTFFHAAAILALFMFNWRDVFVAAAIYFVSLSWGIGMGYHRLLTHRGYKCSKLFEYFVTVCGMLALEGGAISWVATHRVHHQNSDKEGDPHSPNDGGWWAHSGWIIFGEGLHNNTALMSKFAPDLARDRVHRWLNTYHWLPVTVLGFILLAIGGWSMVMWGLGFRVCLGLHSTWLVNSATHMFGRRRFNTHDDSRNSWWVAMLTFGEGWHNNHHAHPTSARHGLAWYELDITYIQIRALEMLGVISDVYVPRWREQPALEREVELGATKQPAEQEVEQVA